MLTEAYQPHTKHKDDNNNQTTSQCTSNNAASTVAIPLANIIPSPFQPRQKRIKRSDVADLMASIEALGQLTPVIVAPAPAQPEKYIVHAGHRRCAALEFLGKETVQSLVRDLSEKEARKLAICENLCREDLSCMDQADALEAYAEDYGLSVKAAAGELGISGTTQSRLRLIIAAPEQLREAFRQYEISAFAAELFAKLEQLRPGIGVRRTELFHEKKLTLTKVQREVEELTASRTTSKGKRRGRRPKSSVHYKTDDNGFELRIRLLSDEQDEAALKEAREALQECLQALEAFPDRKSPVQETDFNENN